MSVGLLVSGVIADIPSRLIDLIYRGLPQTSLELVDILDG